MPMEIDPIRGAESDIPVQGILVLVFDYMEMLDAKALTRTHDRAGIVGLEYILQYHPEVVGPVLDNPLHPCPFFIGNELEEMGD